MTDRDLTPLAVSGRLWEAAVATSADASAAAMVIDTLLASLESGLRRWIGAEGYAALLSRAVAHVAQTHPAIAGIADLGIASADQGIVVPHDDGALRDASIALLCAMMQQLGGIIGDSMAIRLFEQTITPSQRGVAGVESNESSS